MTHISDDDIDALLIRADSESARLATHEFKDIILDGLTSTVRFLRARLKQAETSAKYWQDEWLATKDKLSAANTACTLALEKAETERDEAWNEPQVKSLIRAVAFHRKQKLLPKEEQILVGQDHEVWLEEAAYKMADLCALKREVKP